MSSGTPILWPCPQCHSVNVKAIAPPEEQLSPYLWVRCEDCLEVWPARDGGAAGATVPFAFG
jgi:hypothetical protein